MVTMAARTSQCVSTKYMNKGDTNINIYVLYRTAVEMTDILCIEPERVITHPLTKSLLLLPNSPGLQESSLHGKEKNRTIEKTLAHIKCGDSM